ncbi:MAG TPA: hypothetical protein DEA32_02790 [Firmicutes bacterium]|nr:hypothetical protein [Bacillota bacterium]
MILLQAQNVVKDFDGKPLFKPLNFEIKSGDRTALIGLNGTGKSTILKMAIGQLEPDEGQMIIGHNVKVGYLSQAVITDDNHTIFEEASSVFERSRQLIDDIARICTRIAEHPDDQNLANDYALKEAELNKLGGYDYEYRIRMILNMFGFRREDWERKISTFSGGERTRIAFAKLLLINPDLLLLDEPTNHLDIVTIEWLEDYLKSYSGAVLFVSHDKAFINNLASKILELENGQISIYTGNYDAYALEKQHRYELALKEYNRQQAEMAKIQRFIEFYMPKPRFVSRAHDREKKLARLQASAMDKPYLQKNKVHIDFRGDIREDKKLIRLTDVAIGYPDSPKPLVTDINYEICGRDHIAVMGANGAGKTTFIKTLMGKIPPLQGRIDELTMLNIGYLQQDFTSIQDPRTIFDYFKDNFPLLEDQKIYDHLGKFAFSYEDDREKTLENLSGGEQMRVILAKLCLENYDILILDEPTNHLDLFTKSELEDALGNYQGTLILISHDRDFIDRCADRILYFHDGHAYAHNGSFTDFMESDLKRIMEEEKAKITESSSTHTKGDTRVEKPKKVSEFTVEKLMEKISKKEGEIAALKALCDLPENYTDATKLETIQKSIDAKQKEVDALYTKLNAM